MRQARHEKSSSNGRQYHEGALKARDCVGEERYPLAELQLQIPAKNCAFGSVMTFSGAIEVEQSQELAVDAARGSHTCW